MFLLFLRHGYLKWKSIYRRMVNVALVRLSGNIAGLSGYNQNQPTPPEKKNKQAKKWKPRYDSTSSSLYFFTFLWRPWKSSMVGGLGSCPPAVDATYSSSSRPPIPPAYPFSERLSMSNVSEMWQVTVKRMLFRARARASTPSTVHVVR